MTRFVLTVISISQTPTLLLQLRVEKRRAAPFAYRRLL